MSMRFIRALPAILALALAPAALAGHHESKGKAGKGHEKAMEKAGDARDAAQQRAEDARAGAEEGMEETGGRGAEMRDRRDERKDIMDEAKSTAEPGTPRKGKKPWWRFWESDADEDDAASE